MISTGESYVLKHAIITCCFFGDPTRSMCLKGVFEADEDKSEDTGKSLRENNTNGTEISNMLVLFSLGA